MTAGQPQAPSDAAGPPPDLDDLMGYSLKRAYMILQTAFGAALGEGGMANRVFSALSLVCSHPHLTQSDLARKLGIERSGLVAIVDDLQAQGLIRRVPVPQDRRVQALVPTDAGRAVAAEIHARVKAAEDAVMADFTPAERQTLADLLHRIRRTENDT